MNQNWAQIQLSKLTKNQNKSIEISHRGMHKAWEGLESPFQSSFSVMHLKVKHTSVVVHRNWTKPLMGNADAGWQMRNGSWVETYLASLASLVRKRKLANIRLSLLQRSSWLKDRNSFDLCLFTLFSIHNLYQKWTKNA